MNTVIQYKVLASAGNEHLNRQIADLMATNTDTRTWQPIGLPQYRRGMFIQAMGMFYTTQPSM